MAQVNARPMKKLGVSWRDLFERLEPPGLRPLPATRYELATWKDCTVNIDYHIQVADNNYSVPHQLVHQRVEARLTATTIEIFTAPIRSDPVAPHRVDR